MTPEFGTQWNAIVWKVVSIHSTFIFISLSQFRSFISKKRVRISWLSFCWMSKLKPSAAKDKNEINWTSRCVVPHGLPSWSNFDLLSRSGFCKVKDKGRTLQPDNPLAVVTVIQLPPSSEYPLNNPNYQPGTATILKTTEDGGEEFSEQMEVPSDEMRAVCNLTGSGQRLALCKSIPLAK